MSARTLIIAEAGVNHDGDMDKALALIDVAAAAGADVVKFQSFTASKVISRTAEKAAYQKAATGGAESQLDMVRKLELSPAAHVAAAKRCREAGVEFMSTPFDMEAARYLKDVIGVSRLKIPSGEVTNLPFLHAIGGLGLPVILSTGASTMDEVAEALSALAAGYAGVVVRSAADFTRFVEGGEGARELPGRVMLLHCTSEYPSPPQDANLRVMAAMQARFALPVGLSDHTIGIAIPIAAVAMGATCIEKHFTLDSTSPGPDHQASLEPKELEAMIAGIRMTESARGDGVKAPTATELKNLPVIRRSVVADRPIRRGETFDAANLAVKRPAGGLPPRACWDLVGNSAKRDYGPDDLIAFDELG